MPRCSFTKAAPRNLAGPFKWHKHLWRRSILLPILIIFVVRCSCPNTLSFEREGGIPVGNRLFISHSFDSRHNILRFRQATHCRNTTYTTMMDTFCHIAMDCLWNKRAETNFITNGNRTSLRSEIISKPAIDNDFISNWHW